MKIKKARGIRSINKKLERRNRNREMMQKKNGETAEKGFRGGFVRIKKMGRRRKIGKVDSRFERDTSRRQQRIGSRTGTLLECGIVRS